MITTAVLELYQRFDGFQESFVSQATPEELDINDGCDWYDIESYIQDIFLVERGLAVPTMMDKARASCDSEQTFELLRAIALR